MTRIRLSSLLALATLLFASLAEADGPALLRVERKDAADRDALIAAGVPLVLEHESLFLALGDAPAIRQRLQALGRAGVVVDADTTGASYFVAGLRSGSTPGDLAASCGELVLVEEGWVLLRAAGEPAAACLESSGWFLHRLSLEPFRPTAPLPEPYASWQRGETPLLDVQPVVQTIVDSLTSASVVGTWDEVIGSATTRYSLSAGCVTATDFVFDRFQALGLAPVRQSHTTGHAPNVIGSITGLTHPERVIIVIGHLDDLPSSGLAPGADDNSSGAATVVAAAQAMAGYTFENTVKFLAVTGEEQGLYGSTYYAAQALAAGEQILAVLNADMTGWQGDGLPATGENLDVNTNAASAWLGTLMQQAATAYGTGCVVNSFSCPGMVYSDHAPFWSRGWSAICGITDNEGSCGQAGNYPHYHKSSDTRANCGDPAFYVGSVKAYVATAAHLAVPLCGGGAFPPVPTGVAAEATGVNQITVSWESGGAGLEYEVLRGRGGCEAGDYTPVATTVATHFVDTNVSGGVTYAYRVRARRGECVTEGSLCAAAVTTGSCQEYPVFAGAASAGNGAVPVCTVQVDWEAATPLCAGPVTYNVYRGSTPAFVPGPGNRIATGVAGLGFSDSAGLPPGTTAHYVVRAVDASNGSEDGNTVVRSAVPTGPIASATFSDDAGDTGSAVMTAGTPWAVDATGGHAGAKNYKTVPANNTCGSLTSPPLLLGSGSQLTFWSKWFLDIGGGDKGQVEVSTDGGASWARLTMGYPATSNKTGDGCGLPSGRTYFTGINTTWTPFTASLAGFAGQTVRIRFRISTDASPTGETWWIDDVAVTNVLTPGACTAGIGGLEPRGLSVDALSFGAGTSNANGVLEPGEEVQVSPAWRNASPAAIETTGAASGLAGPAGATYALLDAAAGYGTIDAGAEGTCAADSYALGVDDPATRPAAHWDLTFLETLSTGATRTWTVHVGRSFDDVPPGHWAYRFVETIFHSGITSGCGPSTYCPERSLTRAEMAVLLLMAEHGPAWQPPAPTGGVFSDVPGGHWAGAFVEALAAEGITSGCAPGLYCPDDPITRAQMAVFLLVARHGPGWTPPAPTGTVFTDVPAGHWAGAFIEALAAEGITTGCGPQTYCPDSPVSRAEMAVFLTTTFGLVLH
jgi:hypothetical protein